MRLSDDLVHVLEMLAKAPDSPAQHRVRLASMHHEGRGRRRLCTDDPLGFTRGSASATGQLVVRAPVVADALVLLDIDEFEVPVGLHA